MTLIGNYSVIADVSASLVKLLRENMTPDPIPQPEMIGLASPVDKGDFYLSLYLYNVRESGNNRQTHMIARGTNEIQFPPMVVDLSYIVTVQSPAELSSRALDEHRILGRAMQVFYDHSILRGSMTVGTLAEQDEEVRIIMDPFKGESLMNMWNFSDTPYRLSIAYTVGPVHIDSTRIRTTKRVSETDFRIQG
ncbi:hypothetical protein PAECIP111891_03976 [Paenibacillus allorhizoplanae]|uniref:Pvc16 N-terminal domain-containing protein n=1 Tax=Paenibacillus allorhizoplanae TaxID=2905648 RepID=A0ABM9CI35_9BACL|nr:DUF4255 domain-containing protein [Paenibacillus allorhizoplanae]CAH1213474.1 hypothetical protein PAECIP111891_03976 [Paenibacillus allorhizoplanae]